MAVFALGEKMKHPFFYAKIHSKSSFHYLCFLRRTFQALMASNLPEKRSESSMEAQLDLISRAGIKYDPHSGLLVCTHHGAAFRSAKSLAAHLSTHDGAHKLPIHLTTVTASSKSFLVQSIIRDMEQMECHSGIDSATDSTLPKCVGGTFSTPMHDMYRNAPESLSSLHHGLNPIPHVRVHNGFQCFCCSFCSIEIPILQKHLIKEHDIPIKEALIKAGACPEKLLQTIGRGRFQKFFPVVSLRIADHQSSLRQDETDRSKMKCSHDTEQEPHNAPRIQSSQPSPSASTDADLVSTIHSQIQVRRRTHDAEVHELQKGCSLPLQESQGQKSFLLHRCPFDVMLANMGFSNIQDVPVQLTDKPRSESGDAMENFIRNHLRRYATHLFNEVYRDSAPSLRRIVAPREQTGRHQSRMFHKCSRESSARTYADHIARLVCFTTRLYKIHKKRSLECVPDVAFRNYVLPAFVEHRVAHYLQQLNDCPESAPARKRQKMDQGTDAVNSDQVWSAKDNALHELLCSLLMVNLSEDSNDEISKSTTSCTALVIHQFIATFSVAEDSPPEKKTTSTGRRFKRSMELSPFLAAYVYFCSMCGMVELKRDEIFPTFQKPGAALDVSAVFNISLNTSFSLARWLLTECQSINTHSRPQTNFIDCLRHKQCAIVNGSEISVEDIRKAAERLFREADNIIHGPVLLNATVPANYDTPLANLIDDFTNATEGFSLLELSGSRKWADEMAALLPDHITSNAVLCHQWFTRTDDDDSVPIDQMNGNGMEQWKLRKCASQKWLQAVYKLKKILFVLTHILSGGTARASELETYTFQNSSTKFRNVFISQGELYFICDYGKSESLRGWQKPIVRVVSGQLATLWILYFSCVRPWECFVIGKVNQLLSSTAHNIHLFAEDNKPLKADKLRVIFNSILQEQGVKIGFQTYRHWQAGIVRRYVGKQHHSVLFMAMEEENDVQRDGLDSFFPLDEQSGHTHSTAEKFYARSSCFPIGVQLEKVAEFRAASLQWASFILNRPPPYFISEQPNPGEVVGSSRAPVQHSSKLFAETFSELRLRLEKEMGTFFEEVKDDFARLSKRIRGVENDHLNAYPVSHKDIAFIYQMIQKIRDLSGDPDGRFRSPLQLYTTIAVLDREDDILIIMPTGSGKSYLFILPSFIEQTAPMLCPGQLNLVQPFTIVVLPLVALVQDMVRRCTNMAKNRMEVLTWGQRGRAKSRSGTGGLIIISAEHVLTTDYQDLVTYLVSQKRLSRIVVDEAHLTVQWSTFREAMLELRHCLRPVASNVPVPCIMMSATVPPEMEQAVKLAHGAPFAKTVRTSTARNNLSFQVVRCETLPFKRIYNTMMAKSISVLTEETERLFGKAAESEDSTVLSQIIVYCGTHAVADFLHEAWLENLALPSFTIWLRYHSGMSAEERSEVMERWFNHQHEGRAVMIVFCTSGFGTGIDSPHVRTVIHVGGSRSLVEYAQESGRAGRSGCPATCIVIFNAKYFHTVLNPTWASFGKDENNGHPNYGDHFVSWAEQSVRCRRQLLYSAVDGSSSDICAVLSDDSQVWCDVCKFTFSTSQPGTLRSPSECPIREDKPTSGSHIHGERCERTPLKIQVDTKNSTRAKNTRETLGSTVARDISFCSATSRKVTEQIHEFHQRISKLSGKCIVCIVENNEWHDTKNSCLKNRCFRCLLPGHDAAKCPALSPSAIESHKISLGIRFLCYACRMNEFKGEPLHRDGEFGSRKRCPILASLHLCFMVVSRSSSRNELEHAEPGYIRWPSVISQPPGKHVNVAKELLDWATSTSTNGSLNLMDVVKVFFSLRTSPS